MINIDELEDKFSIEGEVGFSQLEGDLVYLSVWNKYADVDICLYGAHITNFKPYNTSEILWLSPTSYFEEGKPIRGGIPVCFPWFGPHKTDAEKPQHGFVRLMYWDVIHTESMANGETVVKLQLCSSEATKLYWNHDFCAEMTIVVGLKLSVSLKITNTSAKAFEYTCALHSYFSLSSIENITIDGLHNTKYYDQLSGKDGIQETEQLIINEPITHHYYNTDVPCYITDSAFNRTIMVDKLGSKATTVWNPWKETCANIADLPDEAYHAFLCLETVNAYGDEIHLEAGESHETTAIIGLNS